jgi:hypothetical protein
VCQSGCNTCISVCGRHRWLHACSASNAQHSAAQRSTAQRSIAQHSAAPSQRSTAQQRRLINGKRRAAKHITKQQSEANYSNAKQWTAQHTADLHITCNTAEYIHAHQTVVSTLKRPCMHRECEEADLISRLSDGHGRDGNDSRYEVCLGRLVRLLVESSVGCGCFCLFRRC